jgi:hypothetical protein
MSESLIEKVEELVAENALELVCLRAEITSLRVLLAEWNAVCQCHCEGAENVAEKAQALLEGKP